MIYDLPTSINLGGKDYEIRTDFRDIITILTSFGDPDLEEAEKQYICLRILYKEFPPDNVLEEACEKAISFIDCGMKQDGSSKRTMDWEQDAPLIFAAVNRTAGQEVRALDYMHWWTFTGYFMEIRDSIYSTVLNLRNKKAKGKKLEKHEKEFWAANKNVCELKPKLTKQEKEEKAALLALLG